MAVFALWSAPRARSTAFFRSMAQRGDLTVLHEPFCNLNDYGETDVGERTFDSPASLLAWLHDKVHSRDVFLKDTMDQQHDEVLADRRFLAETRHAFLIRRPEEIAASYYALFPPMTIKAIGMERLCEMQAAISDAGGNPPTIIDSDDLIVRPTATMAAYCTTIGLPFYPRALTWEPSSPNGGDPLAGIRTPATARASSGAKGYTCIPSRTPRSWHDTRPITGPSTSNSWPSGWTLRLGSKEASGQAIRSSRGPLSRHPAGLARLRFSFAG